jgi:hypothetical protein
LERKRNVVKRREELVGAMSAFKKGDSFESFKQRGQSEKPSGEIMPRLETIASHYNPGGLASRWPCRPGRLPEDNGWVKAPSSIPV